MVPEEDLSMASRISRRRQQAIERRFSASPYAHQLAQDVLSQARADRERLRGLVDMLVQMGFELTLCQKAVGQFGDDMSAAVAWLTDDAAQQQQP